MDNLGQAQLGDLSGLNQTQLSLVRLTPRPVTTTGMTKTSLHVASCPLPGCPWHVQCWKYFQPKIKLYKVSRPTTYTVSLPPHSMGQNTSPIQPRFEGWGNRHHAPLGRVCAICNVSFQADLQSIS